MTFIHDLVLRCALIDMIPCYISCHYLFLKEWEFSDTELLSNQVKCQDFEMLGLALSFTSSSI